MNPDDISTILQLIKDTYGAAAGGALAALSVFVFGVVKVIRLPLVQTVLGKISPKLQWASWPKWGCVLFVFVGTFLGAFLSALAGGVAWLPALIAGVSLAVPVAMGALGADSTENSIKDPASTNTKETVANPT